MANSSLLYEAKIPKYKVYHITKLICYSLRPKMLNSVKKLQIFYAKSPEISLATSPAEQAVHGVLFTFNLRTFGYRLLLKQRNERAASSAPKKHLPLRPATQLLCHQKTT